MKGKYDRKSAFQIKNSPSDTPINLFARIARPCAAKFRTRGNVKGLLEDNGVTRKNWQRKHEIGVLRISISQEYQTRRQ